MLESSQGQFLGILFSVLDKGPLPELRKLLDSPAIS